MYYKDIGEFQILEPLHTIGDQQQKEVLRVESWQRKDKTIHLLVYSPHGSKLFLLLPLHFHRRTFGSHLMLVANQCKSHRISFHPWEATYDFFHPTMLVWTPVAQDACEGLLEAASNHLVPPRTIFMLASLVWSRPYTHKIYVGNIGAYPCQTSIIAL